VDQSPEAVEVVYAPDGHQSAFARTRLIQHAPDMFDVRVKPHPNNLAFTGLTITPHTDNAYRDPVPTVQLLHCLSKAAEGGERPLLVGASPQCRAIFEVAGAQPRVLRMSFD
jgi:hypothetical protein